MTRREELASLLKDGDAKQRIEAERLINEVCFLEEQMTELKKFPFISVNPKDPTKQKTTPAARQYKELLQQYNNSFKLLLHILGELGADRDDTEESPLRAWVRMQKEDKV